MIVRFIRQCLSIWCAVFLLVGLSNSVIYAQFDTRSLHNRNARGAQNAQPANPAAETMRAMQESRQNLPWNALSTAAQTKVRSVVSGNPLFHRMPQQTFYADPEMYNFLLRHPDVVIGFWEHLGATQLSLREIKENHYILTETGGTTASVEVLYRSYDLCIIYARGEYRGPLMARAYQGDAILVLRTQFARDEANEPVIISDLDTFVQVNSVGLDLLAKLFFTSLTKIADSNFEVTMGFVSQISRAAARNGEDLKEAAEEIPSLRQDVFEEFCAVVDRVAMRFARRNMPQPKEPQPGQPQPRAVAQQTPQFVPPQPATPPRMESARVEPPIANHRDFAPRDFTMTSRPPSDWGMDHFFDSSAPPYAPVRYDGSGELNAPRPLGSTFFEYVIPRLPRNERDYGIVR